MYRHMCQVLQVGWIHVFFLHHSTDRTTRKIPWRARFQTRPARKKSDVLWKKKRTRGHASMLTSGRNQQAVCSGLACPSSRWTTKTVHVIFWKGVQKVKRSLRGVHQSRCHRAGDHQSISAWRSMCHDNVPTLIEKKDYDLSILHTF